MKSLTTGIGVLGLVVAAAMPALAEPTAEPAKPATAEALFGAGQKVEGSDLATITGQGDTAMMVRAQNTSNVSHNSVSGNSQTGTISFDTDTFRNLSGLSLLSANTGNNVSINSSLNVNVAVRP